MWAYEVVTPIEADLSNVFISSLPLMTQTWLETKVRMYPRVSLVILLKPAVEYSIFLIAFWYLLISSVHFTWCGVIWSDLLKPSVSTRSRWSFLIHANPRKWSTPNLDKHVCLWCLTLLSNLCHSAACNYMMGSLSQPFLRAECH